MSENEKGDWFDDPEWEEIRRKQGNPSYKLSKSEQKQLRRAREAELKAREQQAKQKQDAADRGAGKVPEEPKKIDVSLNLTLPNLKVGKFKKKVTSKVSQITPDPVKKQLKEQLGKRSKKQLSIVGASLAVVLVIGILGLIALNHGDKGNGTDKGVLAEQTVKIDFKPLLPNGKTEETTAYKAAEDGQGRPIYTFTDQIGSVDLTVSEQPLPEKLKTNTDSELDKMAKDLYLTEVINQSNPKAYLGTNVKGPQTVIFTKNGLLVFIQSKSKIDKDQWSDYVTRLIES